MSTHVEPAPLFGGFRVGNLDVALPVAAVREVVPLEGLRALPCSAPGLAGAVSLRGALLPLVDLFLLQGTGASQGGNVLVMLHEGRLLGLRIDAVCGLFTARPGSVQSLRTEAGTAMVLAGSLCRGDDGALLGLLSPAVLFGLPGVPLLADPQPERSDANPLAGIAEGEGAGEQTLLLECGGLPLAIPAMAVHATLASPPIEASPLAGGICSGVTRYAGALAPVVDLLGLCGLGRQTSALAGQAFLVRVGSGLVCLLVGRVIDVISATASQVLALPASTLPEPQLIRGLLPVHALPEVHRVREAAGEGHFLVLEPAALCAAPPLQALVQALAGSATVHTGQEIVRVDSAALAGGQGKGSGPGMADHPGASAAPHRGAGTGRPLLIYELPGRVATALDQIVEILPWNPQALRPRSEGVLLALMVNRGRSLPVLDLAQLLGVACFAPKDTSNVLLVECGCQMVGFVVPRLLGIEHSTWEAREGDGPDSGPEGGDAGKDLRRASRLVVRVGTDAEARLLRVIDLQALASLWLSPHPASRSTPGTPVRYAFAARQQG